MKILYLVILISLLLMSCKNKATDSELKEPITSINVDQHIEDTLYIEAGDFFQDLSLVRLETNSSIMLGNIYGIVRSDDYFIISPERGSYLFTKDGRFLRELYRSGRGPEEFLYPRFSSRIVNGILYLEDWSKRQDRYYGINLESGEIKVIEKPLAWRSHDFMVDEEGIIAAFGEFVPEGTDHARDPSRIIKRDLYFQDMNGNLINTYDHGFSEHGKIWGFAEMHFLSKDIYLTTPLGKTILRIRDNKSDTIWTNFFETEYKRGDIPGKHTYASLIYYSSEKVLIQKQEVEITTRSGRHARKGIILVNRNEGTAKIIKSFLKTRKNMLNLTTYDFTRDGFLCKVIYAHQIVEMMKDPEMEAYLNDLIRKGSWSADEPVSIDDNPFILIGRISDNDKHSIE
ncbi:MAG: 6-bladed beta-propeller [Bacteroidales bacterium]